MTTGLLCGKFYPCHVGHKYLMDYATTHADDVYGFVVYEENEWPGVYNRLEWVKEIAPSITWTVVKNTPGKEADSAHWAKEASRALERMKYKDNVIDYVFSSEDYGDTWAKELGCKHIKVDLARDTYHISGTRCRTNPWAEWEYLTPPVKQFYAKRVCIVGGESTGKSTMARMLAEEFDTLWVPEVGRFYVEEWGEEDPEIWKAILATQLEFENHLARLCNKVLICDTDLMTTSVWYEAWTDNDSVDIMERLVYKPKQAQYARYNPGPYDLYIFLTPDVPWVQDGTRTESDNREWFADKLFNNVTKSNIPYIVIKGKDYNDRYARAAQAVAELMNG